MTKGVRLAKYDFGSVFCSVLQKNCAFRFSPTKLTVVSVSTSKKRLKNSAAAQQINGRNKHITFNKLKLESVDHSERPD